MLNFLGLPLRPLDLRSFLSTLCILIICAGIILKILQICCRGKSESAIYQITYLVFVGVIVYYCINCFPEGQHIFELLDLARNHLLVNLIIIGLSNYILDILLCAVILACSDEKGNLFGQTLAFYIVWLGGAIIAYFITQELTMFVVYLVANSCALFYTAEKAVSIKAETMRRKETVAKAEELKQSAPTKTPAQPEQIEDEDLEKLDYDEIINELKSDPEGEDVLDELLRTGGRSAQK